MVEKWQELIADKQKRRDESIPKEWVVYPPPADRLNVLDFPEETGLLNEFELEVTASPVEVLLPKLASGEWSSVDVTKAFYKRAIIAHQAVNCLTEIFVDKALERAAYLDEELKKTGKPIGPLHGLPISLKDQLAIKGFETTMGYVSWIGNYAEKDATLVEILYEQGAVPFVRTNIPQTLMWPETFNNVFGRTSNPANRTLTCGGSSGGEGALIAMKGSPLGVGSDIGGSVRIPANFNGLSGSAEDYASVTSITGEPLITTMSLNPNDPTFSKTRNFLIPPQAKSAYGLWQIQKERTRLRCEHLDYWNSTAEKTGTGRPVDAIIGPMAAWAPPPHGMNSSADYTMMWNALDYPSLAFPVTTVDPKLDKVKPPHQFLSEDDEAAYALFILDEGPELFKDAPIGLQVVGRTGEDEAVIAMGEIIDKALKESKK
ncbi:hypothetical protein M422DRAFT_55911 [Sphaerobolus stellatus SS14]|uniref:amidase n=1 Tax=Sphaerobolus stellatus (strain SS14) TaxID=990650 RepID=A0A0C9TUT8_SPHS4|nr:hypothetical protein M422DRAFT_55911 [Sphaerobolus stellatus SS14]